MLAQQPLWIFPNLSPASNLQFPQIFCYLVHVACLQSPCSPFASHIMAIYMLNQIRIFLSFDMVDPTLTVCTFCLYDAWFSKQIIQFKVKSASPYSIYVNAFEQCHRIFLSKHPNSSMSPFKIVQVSESYVKTDLMRTLYRKHFILFDSKCNRKCICQP